MKNVMRRIAWVAVLAAACHSSVLPAAEQDMAAAVAANNAFAFDLYKQLAKENEGENACPLWSTTPAAVGQMQFPTSVETTSATN